MRHQGYLEAIHLFVEILDQCVFVSSRLFSRITQLLGIKARLACVMSPAGITLRGRYFGNVCELDLVFNFNKVSVCLPSHAYFVLCESLACILTPSAQVFMLLDEFILAGEVQETSKQVILGCAMPSPPSPPPPSPFHAHCPLFRFMLARCMSRALAELFNFLFYC